MRDRPVPPSLPGPGSHDVPVLEHDRSHPRPHHARINSDLSDRDLHPFLDVVHEQFRHVR